MWWDSVSKIFKTSILLSSIPSNIYSAIMFFRQASSHHFISAMHGPSASLIFQTNIPEDDTGLVLLFYLQEMALKKLRYNTMLAKDILMLFWRHTDDELREHLSNAVLFFLCLHNDIEYNFDLINHSVLVVWPPSKNLIVVKSSFELYGQHSCSFPGTVRDSTLLFIW